MGRSRTTSHGAGWKMSINCINGVTSFLSFKQTIAAQKIHKWRFSDQSPPNWHEHWRHLSQQHMTKTTTFTHFQNTIRTRTRHHLTYNHQRSQNSTDSYRAQPDSVQNTHSHLRPQLCFFALFDPALPLLKIRQYLQLTFNCSSDHRRKRETVWHECSGSWQNT